VFAGPQVGQAGQHGLGGRGIAAQRGQPALVAGEDLVAGQRVGIRGLGKLGVGGVPVAEHQQRLGQVDGRRGQPVPVAGPARVPGGGPRGVRRRLRIGGRQDIRQVEQGDSQAYVVVGLAGQPRALAVVGGRLGAPVSNR
jgi:hypothetical protein